VFEVVQVQLRVIVVALGLAPVPLPEGLPVGLKVEVSEALMISEWVTLMVPERLKVEVGTKLADLVAEKDSDFEAVRTLDTVPVAVSLKLLKLRVSVAGLGVLDVVRDDSVKRVMVCDGDGENVRLHVPEAEKVRVGMRETETVLSVWLQPDGVPDLLRDDDALPDRVSVAVPLRDHVRVGSDGVKLVVKVALTSPDRLTDRVLDPESEKVDVGTRVDVRLSVTLDV